MRTLILWCRHSSIRHTRITEEIRRTILTRETEVTGAIVAQDKQLVEANNRLQEVLVVDAARGADETVQEKAEERAALNACRKVLEGLLSKT